MVTEALIAGCIREDRKAQYGLYKALYPLMMSICSRYERNRQDAVARMNAGFLKILQNIGNRGKDVPFEPWVRRVIINTVIDEFRKDRQRRDLETIGTPVLESDTDHVNEYLITIEAEAFEVMIQRLPPVSRSVFNLFAIDGYSHAEIAEMLGISTGTSKWHVSHARAVLQQALKSTAPKKVSIR